MACYIRLRLLTSATEPVAEPADRQGQVACSTAGFAAPLNNKVPSRQAAAQGAHNQGIRFINACCSTRVLLPIPLGQGAPQQPCTTYMCTWSLQRW